MRTHSDVANVAKIRASHVVTAAFLEFFFKISLAERDFQENRVLGCGICF